MNVDSSKSLINPNNQKLIINDSGFSILRKPLPSILYVLCAVVLNPRVNKS